MCEWCERYPDQACRACAARRRQAVRLAQRGLTVAQAARWMGLSVARVQRLLEEDADRRALAAYVARDVENEPLRRLLARRQRIDPALTVAELARRLGTSQVQVERWLGLRETAPKTTRDGRRYPARLLSRIGVEAAGRLVRAMGCAPCEIDGC
jgi:hypothetical protein